MPVMLNTLKVFISSYILSASVCCRLCIWPIMLSFLCMAMPLQLSLAHSHPLCSIICYAYAYKYMSGREWRVYSKSSGIHLLIVLLECLIKLIFL